MMAEVDDGLKSIRLALSASVDGAQDAWANTLLVLHSDNGGVRAHGSANLPLRGEKAEYFEGGVRRHSAQHGQKLSMCESTTCGF